MRHTNTQARTWVNSGVAGQLAGGDHGDLAGGTQSGGIVAGVSADQYASTSLSPHGTWYAKCANDVLPDAFGRTAGLTTVRWMSE